MTYHRLPDNIVNEIKDFPPVKEAFRTLNFYLKDGSARNEVVVVGGEFFAMDPSKHSYFEAADIHFTEPA